MRAENVPVAICTTRTVTVTTKPVSAAVAPMIEDRTVLAVDGRVLPQRRRPDVLVGERDGDAENPAEHGSRQRDDPEALEQAFAQTEPPGPSHLARLTSRVAGRSGG